MYVRTLIGRNAGDIIDLPHHAATSGLSMGTCAAVTDDEIAAALPSLKSASSAPAETFPEGFTASPTEVGGYLLSGPDGAVISEQPFPNLSAARSAAEAMVAAAAVAEPAKKSKSEK